MVAWTRNVYHIRRNICKMLFHCKQAFLLCKQGQRIDYNNVKTVMELYEAQNNSFFFYLSVY